MVAMPGLVNCHTHLATTLMRGFLDDASRAEALEQLPQARELAQNILAAVRDMKE